MVHEIKDKPIGFSTHEDLCISWLDESSWYDSDVRLMEYIASRFDIRAWHKDTLIEKLQPFFVLREYVG